MKMMEKRKKMENRKMNKPIEIMEMILMMHFPQIYEDAGKGIIQDDDYFERVLKCENCEDYKSGCCPGENRNGESVLDCMKEKMECGECGFVGKLPFRDN
jgi:hypothetical protein